MICTLLAEEFKTRFANLEDVRSASTITVSMITSQVFSTFKNWHFCRYYTCLQMGISGYMTVTK